MPTLICRRCDRRGVWGLLSAQAWLEHRNGSGETAHVCPDCCEQMNAQEQHLFLQTGHLPGRGLTGGERSG
jgi:hypothetical protein